MTTKKRTIEEYRQVKDSVYTPPSPKEDMAGDVPTHDPQTGELNPYYEELTGETNPLSYAGDTQNVVVGEETTQTYPTTLQWRMYGLVPYNISPIQQAIQYGHAIVEYADDVMSKRVNNIPYYTWARRDKTFIILNGGTTNANPDTPGTLNLHVEMLNVMDVPNATFYEPDLGNQLTAVVFLVDERVWDKETYPDFVGGFESMEETTEEAHYEQLWGEDWRSILQLRLFISQFKLA